MRPGLGRGRWQALGGSALLTGRLIGVLLTIVATVLAFALVLIGVGIWLFPACIRALRSQALGIASMHARWTAIELRVPMLRRADSSDARGRARHTWDLLSDPATWRLLRWAAVDSCTGVGIFLAVAPLAFVAQGVQGVVVMPLLWLIFRITPAEWYAFIPVFDPAMIPLASLLGVAFIAVGFLTGPWWLRLHGRWAAALLGTANAELRERVGVLSVSRTEARNDAADELRRLEREVHDGTQSQLVTIGLTLGTAEALMVEDPERARELVAKARDDSTAALAELRDLIRGIRPPILADRGLGSALESLALDASTTVTTHIDLPDRLDAALETTVYFAVRELLSNAIKHAAATRVTVDARADAARLTVTVTDDGRGGATILPGHGLDGIRRRLAAFDGTLVITSPTEGPTTVEIEAPCGS